MNTPKQERSRISYEGFLTAAQYLLEEHGLDKLSSNAIIERAGMTPPAFYRWFENKYEVLRVLSDRLMSSQNQIIQTGAPDRLPTIEEIKRQTQKGLHDTLGVTRNFRGGYELMVSIRAIPELVNVRLDSHENMAHVIATNLLNVGYDGDRAEIISKARLSIEIGYATIEMLFETDFGDCDFLIESAATAIASLW